jgi:hypothetical protein
VSSPCSTAMHFPSVFSCWEGCYISGSLGAPLVPTLCMIMPCLSSCLSSALVFRSSGWCYGGYPNGRLRLCQRKKSALTWKRNPGRPWHKYWVALRSSVVFSSQRRPCGSRKKASRSTKRRYGSTNRRYRPRKRGKSLSALPKPSTNSGKGVDFSAGRAGIATKMRYAFGIPRQGF